MAYLVLDINRSLPTIMRRGSHHVFRMYWILTKAHESIEVLNYVMLTGQVQTRLRCHSHAHVCRARQFRDDPGYR